MMTQMPSLEKPLQEVDGVERSIPHFEPRTQESTPTRSRGYSYLLIAMISVLATLLPLLLYVHRYPSLAPFSLFENDTFYYLNVARNSQFMPFYTFDGVHATNGFHPVWQFLLYVGVKYHYLDFSNPTQALTRLFYANLLILGAAVAVLAFFAAGRFKRSWLALITVCPGWLWFGSAICAPDYLANWSYLNGMETSIELLFFGLALVSYRQTRVRLFLTGLMLGMMVLSRLDDVFFLLPIVAFVIYSAPATMRRVAAWCCGIPFLMIAGYLAYNLWSVGMAMPISGASKAGLAVFSNTLGLIRLFLPDHWIAPLSKSVIGYSEYSEHFVRVFQMIVPMILSVLYVSLRRRRSWSLIDALCIGVLLKGMYNFVFVALWSQGHWYYGPSIFLSNLVVALVLDALITRYLQGTALSPRLGYAGVGAEVLLLLLSINIFVNDKLNNGTGSRAEAIFEGRSRILGMLQASNGNKFMEFDDGLLGFSTNMRTLSGTGLVLDQEALKARKDGRFFELAIARGDQLVMAEGAYANTLENFSSQSVLHPKGELFGIHAAEFVEYNLQAIAVDSKTDVRLYRLVRRPG